ncbi:MAG: hypothetical protein R3C49_18290 [Planctomycetaceae bacterium]
MSTSEERLRIMLLSGTVTIPPRLPDLADISFKSLGSRIVVEATQVVSPRTTIRRTFFPEDVMAVFVPDDSTAVDLTQGEFLTGDKLDSKALSLLDKCSIQGIVYVREHAQSLLELSAGLTAAESAEFYPPLPTDRSVNHYDMNPGGSRLGDVGCPW